MKKGEENERNIFIKDSAGNEGVAGAGFKKKRNDTYRTYNVDFERVQKANGSEIATKCRGRRRKMKELLGKKWGELEEATRTGLLSKAAAVDGVTGNNKTAPGECIVDFLGTILSIPGKVNEDLEIEIDDEAKIYCSAAE